MNEKGNAVELEFAENALLPEFVQFIVENYAKNTLISAAKRPTVKYRFDDKKKILSNIKFLLQQLNELHIENK